MGFRRAVALQRCKCQIQVRCICANLSFQKDIQQEPVLCWLQNSHTIPGDPGGGRRYLHRVMPVFLIFTVYRHAQGFREQGAYIIETGRIFTVSVQREPY